MSFKNDESIYVDDEIRGITSINLSHDMKYLLTTSLDK